MSRFIKQFDLTVYPVDLVVVIGKEAEDEINSKYTVLENESAWIAWETSYDAITFMVKEKLTNKTCIMIWVESIDACRASIIAHECGHAAMCLFSYIDAKIDIDNQEPFCYLLGTLTKMVTQCYYELRDNEKIIDEHIEV